MFYFFHILLTTLATSISKFIFCKQFFNLTAFAFDFPVVTNNVETKTLMNEQCQNERFNLKINLSKVDSKDSHYYQRNKPKF